MKAPILLVLPTVLPIKSSPSFRDDTATRFGRKKETDNNKVLRWQQDPLVSKLPAVTSWSWRNVSCSYFKQEMEDVHLSHQRPITVPSPAAAKCVWPTVPSHHPMATTGFNNGLCVRDGTETAEGQRCCVLLRWTEVESNVLSAPLSSAQQRLLVVLPLMSFFWSSAHWESSCQSYYCWSGTCAGGGV